MKKIKFMAATICIVLSAFGVFLIGCNPPPPPPIPEDGADIIIIVGDYRFELNTHERYLKGAILELVEYKDIVFEYSNHSWGVMVDRIGDLVNGYDGAWLILHLDYNNPAWATPDTYVLDGITFFSANVGISDMPVIDGVAYLFVLMSF